MPIAVGRRAELRCNSGTACVDAAKLVPVAARRDSDAGQRLTSGSAPVAGHRPCIPCHRVDDMQHCLLSVELHVIADVVNGMPIFRVGS